MFEMHQNKMLMDLNINQMKIKLIIKTLSFFGEMNSSLKNTQLYAIIIVLEEKKVGYGYAKNFI